MGYYVNINSTHVLIYIYYFHNIIKGLIVYNSLDIEKELSLIDIKVGIKLSLISIFSVQIVFQILSSIYIQVTSHFQLTSNYFNVFYPRGLSYFSWDMWFIIILFSFVLLGYSKLKKVKYFPLYLLFIYPSTLIIFSLLRDVSLIQVAIFSLLSCSIVIYMSYQRIINLEYSKV